MLNHLCQQQKVNMSLNWSLEPLQLSKDQRFSGPALLPSTTQGKARSAGAENLANVTEQSSNRPRTH